MDTKQRKQQNRATQRFQWIFYFMCVLGLCILGKALHTMLFEHEYWFAVSKRFSNEDIAITADRGELLDCKGRTMVSSVPEYELYLDINVVDKDSVAQEKAQAWRDSALVASMDSICDGLAAIFPGKKPDYFRKKLEHGIERGRKRRNMWSEKKQAYVRKPYSCRLAPGRATYIQYRDCQKLPVLREKTFKGGFHGKEIMMRKKPYGSLATRTLGIYDDSARARNGIELAYDSILRGIDGRMHRNKVRNKRVSFIDQFPESGHDLMTTIDVDIQDVAEKAIVAQMHNMREKTGATAELGMVIVMEAATGDVKALVNMSLCGDGQYYEIRNNALGDRMEPGSTFKTASIMAAIEDGRTTKTTMVQTGCGLKKMYGRNMKDVSYTSGGYGLIDVKKIMQKSSNVGVSTVIDDAYKGDPENFVKAILREGMGIPLGLPIAGAVDPLIKDPKSKHWYKTTLPWMSIGYETLLPPISTCTFYNGIANGGKMVKPRFVKAEIVDGKVVKEFPVEVLREKMCSKETLADIQEILESVVSAEKATGNRAACPQFKVSGKTGTAQIAGNKNDGGKGYSSGRHLVTFCGYFPSDAPKYTCLVAIKAIGPCGGGTSCAPVFSQIAQCVMANGVHRIAELASDSTSHYLPYVWNGNMTETVSVLKQLGINYQSTWAASTGTLWGQANDDQRTKKQITLTATPTPKNKVPDVKGMGARDAVFTLQQCGFKVKIEGAGHVVDQSIEPGSDIKKGLTVNLTMG